MKAGDIMALLHPEKFRDARAAHKVWNDELVVGKNKRKLVVDTAFVVDQRCYETGIKDEYWHIVGRYQDETGAENGHSKWVKYCKDNPTAKIPDTLTDAY